MKKPSRTFQNPEDQPEQNSGVSNFACCATGCPLPGVWSENLKGDGPWVCFIHARASYRQYDRATLKIRENAWLYKLLFRIQRTDAYAWEHGVKTACIEHCVSKGMNELAPMKDECQSAYERRLRSELERKCVTSEKEEAQTKKPSLLPEKIADFVPELAL